MSILVVIETKNNEVKKISKEITSLASKLDSNVIALLNNGNAEQAKEIFKSGAKVVVQTKVTDFSPEGYGNLIATVAKEKNANVVLLPHGLNSRDYAGRLAVKLKATLVSDVTEIKGTISNLEITKPIYSGKAYAKIKINTAAVITVRPNTQEVINGQNGEGTLEVSNATEGEVRARLSSLESTGGTKVQLADASVIVSGGRGIKGPENWPILQSLCDTIGAALGASRAAVDAGWISHSHQVGQTGKTVSPNCYIACGISGAIQHLAGMGSSKVIVAINKDAEAPIFKVATYGVVDDLFVFVPALNNAFKKVLG